MENKSAGKLNRLADSLASVRWIDAIILIGGAMMVNQFFSHIAQGTFTSSGFANQVGDYITNAYSPGWWKAVLQFTADNSGFFGPLTGVFVAVMGILLMFLIARGPVAIITSVFCFMLWLSAWGHPGIWIFEYLFPATFLLCAGLATLPHYLAGSTKKERILGPGLFGSAGMGKRLIIILFSSFILWYAVILSHDGKADYKTVAMQSAIAFAILFAILAFTDKMRSNGAIAGKDLPGNSKSRLSARLSTMPWFDIMILIVGSLMAIQVYADIAVNFYTDAGYSSLTSSYAESTGAPQVWKDFLWWSANNAVILMPVQAGFEILIAIFLPLILLRSPMLFLTWGFFFLMMVSEFDVSATVKPGAATTWIWEMLFVTSSLVIMTLAKLPEFLRAKSWKEKFLGAKFYGSMQMKSKLLIAVLGGLALWLSGLATHVFGPAFVTTSWQGGLTFFILLIIMAVIDKYRTQEYVPEKY